MLTRQRGTVVVWKLDRLGRSLCHLIGMVNSLEEKKARFISLQGNLITQTAQGRFIYNVFSFPAEFERDIIRERTQAGLSAARARDRRGGRTKGLSLEAQLKAPYAKKLYADKSLSINFICKKVGVSPRTLYTYIHMEELPINKKNLFTPVPVNYALYHPKWPLISRLICFQRAGGRCECCRYQHDRPHYSRGYKV